MADELVTIELNHGACIGVGQCESLEPDVFRLDDEEGISVIIGDNRLSRQRAEQVVDKCPSGALSIGPIGKTNQLLHND